MRKLTFWSKIDGSPLNLLSICLTRNLYGKLYLLLSKIYRAFAVMGTAWLILGCRRTQWPGQTHTLHECHQLSRREGATAECLIPRCGHSASLERSAVCSWFTSKPHRLQLMILNEYSMRLCLLSRSTDYIYSTAIAQPRIDAMND